MGNHPVAYVLIDCCCPEEDAYFLESTVDLVKHAMEDSEINMIAYQSFDDLERKCLDIIKTIDSVIDNPIQLLWISSHRFAPLYEPSAIAVLALFEDLMNHSRSVTRTVLIHKEEDESVDQIQTETINCLALLMDAVVVSRVCNLSMILSSKEWLIGYVNVQGFDFAVCSTDTQSMKPNGLFTDKSFSILGVIDSDQIQPYLDPTSYLLYFVSLIATD